MSYKNPKLLKKKRSKLYWRIGLYVSFVVSLFYGLSFWSHHYFFQIEKIEISDTRFTSTEKIREIYQTESSKKILFLISKNTVFTLPKRTIENKISDLIAIESVNIKRNPLNEVMIEVKEYDPSGVFCSEEKCFFLNNKGKFFTEINKNYPDQVIQFDGQIQGEILGQNYIEENIFEKIIQTIDLLKQIEININKIQTENFESFDLITTQGPKIIIEKRDDPETIINNLKTTLEQEDIHDKQFENLEYLDLRFEDKVYYKIK